SPSARKVTLELISTVNALPRNRSGAPRCTSSALQTIVAPLPAPETITQSAATQTLGDAAAPATPSPIRPSETPYTFASPRTSIHEPARYAPTASPKPAEPIISPSPKLPPDQDSVPTNGSPPFTPT